MLTQTRLKELLQYDPETGVFTWIASKRKNTRAGQVAGCLNKVIGYVQIKIDRCRYYGHRLAWLYVNGEFPPNDIDHINRVRSDNRFCNLRLASHAENMQNRSMHRNNTSGHMGVSWDKQHQKWMAHIKFNEKTINLGRFHSINEAVSARKSAELQFHKFQPAQRGLFHI